MNANNDQGNSQAWIPDSVLHIMQIIPFKILNKLLLLKVLTRSLMATDKVYQFILLVLRYSLPRKILEQVFLSLIIYMFLPLIKT